MRVIATGRQGGKTTACLAWLSAHREDGVIVTPNAIQQDHLAREMSRFYGQSIAYWKLRIINYSRIDILRGQSKKIYIDNADDVLRRLFAGNTVEGVTLTNTIE